MSHGVKYFNWRNGRPRWEPGPSLRARGFQGQDLKLPNGEWLPLLPALDEALKLNNEAGVSATRRKRSRAAEQSASAKGFVYFLRSGEQIKIGFSSGPFSRLQQLKTGVANGINAMGAIEGDMADERQLHNEFRDLHIHGEWFHAKWRLRLFIANCVAAGRITWGKTGRTL